MNECGGFELCGLEYVIILAVLSTTLDEEQLLVMLTLCVFVDNR